MKRFMLVSLLILSLTGCAFTGGEKITDFTDRSVGYGWLDIEDVDANQLHSVVVFQYVPRIDKPYYHAKVKEFKDGYLYYSFAFPNGSFGTYSASGQKCFVFCSNTIYTYDFGKQGTDAAKISIKKPGVYSLGSYKLQEVKTGWFEQGKFNIVPAKNGPSDREMLEEILKDTEGNPVMEQRIKAALK